ncbi:MAG: hypothetical protein ABIF71_12115 [Planctomycetota bacterium]
MDLYKEFFAVAKALNAGGIHYAVVGGIAVGFHGHPRLTKDIDILLPLAEIEAACTVLADLGYQKSTVPWKTTKGRITITRLIRISGSDHMLVDLLGAVNKRDLNAINNAMQAEAAIGMVPVAGRKELIRLKRVRGSIQDLADIEALSHDPH